MLAWEEGGARPWNVGKGKSSSGKLLDKRDWEFGLWGLVFPFTVKKGKMFLDRLNREQKVEVCWEGGGRAETNSGEETDKRLRVRSGKAAQQKQEKCGRQKTRPSAKSKILELHWSARDEGGSRGKEGRESQARNKGGWKELRSGKKLQQY